MQVMNVPRVTATKGRGETVLTSDTLKIYRLVLAEGGTLPHHVSRDDVVLVMLRGSAVFLIDDVPHAVSAGDVLDMVPGQGHAIDATTEIEMIIIHVNLQPTERRGTTPAPVWP